MPTPLGQAIKAERQRRGLTTREVAEEMSGLVGKVIPQPTVNRWETGVVEPAAEHYDAIFRFLGMDEAEGAILVLRSRLARAGLDPLAGRHWRRRGRK